MTYNPLFTEKNTLDAILDYYTPFSLKLRILLSANSAKYIYHKWNWNMSYYYIAEWYLLFFAKFLSHRVKNEKVITKTSSQLNAPVLMTEPP